MVSIYSLRPVYIFSIYNNKQQCNSFFCTKRNVFRFCDPKKFFFVYVRNLEPLILLCIQSYTFGLTPSPPLCIRSMWMAPFEKDFFKLMNNAVFAKTMENVRRHRNITLVTTERRRNYLLSEPNYHTTKFFTENLLATEMEKTQILMNKPVYLGLSILDLNKTVMYEFWYD